LIRNKSLIVWLAVLASGGVFAHAKTTSTLPADGDFVASPGTLVLQFDSPVHLTGIEIMSVAGERLQAGAVPAEPDATFRIDVPEALAPGEYYVVWKAIAADTHFSTGEFFFTVIAH
jgi:methionine-rich copper-binding protein CopC